jgi:phage terminase large subunit GpA-like protein
MRKASNRTGSRPARASGTKAAIAQARRYVAPPPRLTVSEWADRERVLSSESGAAAGKWRTLAYQREPFDCFSDPTVHTVVIMSATQLLKTVTVENCVGYLIDNDPGPALVVVPRDIDGDKFSKIRLAPMIRDTPSLRSKVRDVPTKRTGDTLAYKSFPGGHLSIAASGSPANLAALPIRYLFCDEIDKYPATAGAEGDPLSLAAKRQATFWNRKTVLCCSPTIAGESRIDRAYAQSDQRRFHVPCPHCGEHQVLTWSQVKFDKTGTDAERASTARYDCEHCGEPWDDLARWRAVESGRWEASAPFTGIAGFWISELYSPWKRLSDIVGDFLAKRRDPHQLQVFLNTSLAECWRLQGESPDWVRLFARRESYDIGTVPAGGLLLVAAVDCQRDRLEVEIVAYGRERESWSVDYRVISGDPTNTSATGPWWRPGDGLHDVLVRDWPTHTGGAARIMCMAIDSGDRPAPVYEFARRHPQPAVTPTGSHCPSYGTVAATKGNDHADRLITGVSNIDVARQKRAGVRIFAIGTHYAKQELYDLLRLEPICGEGEAVEYPSGFQHCPGYDRVYFQGLCSETRVVRSTGKVEWIADPSIRNEPLDISCMARAAASIAGMDRFRESDWLNLEARMAASPPAPAPHSPSTPPAPAPPIRQVRGHFKI